MAMRLKPEASAAMTVQTHHVSAFFQMINDSIQTAFKVRIHRIDTNFRIALEFTVFKFFTESAQFPDTASKTRVRYFFRRQSPHSLRQRAPFHRSLTLRQGALRPSGREADNQVWAPSYHDPKRSCTAVPQLSQ